MPVVQEGEPNVFPSSIHITKTTVCFLQPLEMTFVWRESAIRKQRTRTRTKAWVLFGGNERRVFTYAPTLFFTRDGDEGSGNYRTPTPLRPRTMPTPMMCPITPHAKVSVAVKPAGSPVCRPESLSTRWSPARAFLLAEGARPNLPATSIRVVDPTMICLRRALKSGCHAHVRK